MRKLYPNTSREGCFPSAVWVLGGGECQQLGGGRSCMAGRGGVDGVSLLLTWGSTSASSEVITGVEKRFGHGYRKCSVLKERGEPAVGALGSGVSLGIIAA